MHDPRILGSYFERPVAILGYGVSGRAVAEVLEKLNVPYTIYDKRGAEGMQLDFTCESADSHLLVVYSPGFVVDHPWLEIAKKAGCLCINELDFGSCFWMGKIIAITGTNGKSTLTTLLAEALREMGVSNAVACGNIGSPLTAQMQYFSDSNAIAVCEVSSFQAEQLRYFSPDVIIWTTFDEDHLDRHLDMRSYFEAKKNLVDRLRTKDFFIGETVEKFAQEHGYSWSVEPTVVLENDFKEEFLSYGIFALPPQRENYCLGLAYWIAQDFDVEVFKRISCSFESLPYRLAKVDEIDGIAFWNDSKGTNFSATAAALRGFEEKVYWIGGGKLKGGDYGGFIEKIASNIQEAFLIGESSSILIEKLREQNVRFGCYSSLDEAVDEAFERALIEGRKREVIFSPGFSSFDMFRSAEDRGKFFEKKVLELKTVQNTLETIQGH